MGESIHFVAPKSWRSNVLQALTTNQIMIDALAYPQINHLVIPNDSGRFGVAQNTLSKPLVGLIGPVKKKMMMNDD
jgi:hypothetical protein